MSKNQDMLKLRDTLINTLGVLNARVQNEESEIFETEDAPVDGDTVAEVGDIVEVVVNPETPEEEIIEGELLGVLDEEEVLEDSTEQTVMVRTKNGRIRKVNIPKAVKITNSRKQNKLTVTSNRRPKGTKNQETGGIKEMRGGDKYDPPVTDGLTITKNRQVFNATLTDDVAKSVKDGTARALKELGIQNRFRTRNEEGEVIGDVEVPEDDAAALVDAVQELSAKIDELFVEEPADEGTGNRRYVSRASRLASRIANRKNANKSNNTRKIQNDAVVFEDNSQCVDSQSLVDAVQALADVVEDTFEAGATEIEGTVSPEGVTLEVVAEDAQANVVCNKQAVKAQPVTQVNNKQPVKAASTMAAASTSTSNVRDTQTNNQANLALDAMLAVANLANTSVLASAHRMHMNEMSLREPEAEYNMIPEATFERPAR